MAKHARLGPSGAYIWTECTASPRESDGKPNDGNDASRMGTACHEVVAECLQHGQDPHDFFGREFFFGKHDDHRIECFREAWPFTDVAPDHVVRINDDMVDFCVAYVNFVRELVEATGAEMLVEQRVPIAHMTGEADAGGTSDVILFYGNTLHIVDAKFGRNKVTAYDLVKPSLPHPVTGEMLPPLYAPNTQMAMYAGGALEAHRMFREFDTVRMTIVQPPINNVSEFQMPLADLEQFLAWIAKRAEETRTNPQYKAGNHCTYCRGRVTCKARDEWVISSVTEGFSDVTDPVQVASARPVRPEVTMLGVYYELLPALKKWAEDIEARLKDALRAGQRVVGPSGEAYKLVAGKRGDRSWDDPEEVERLMKLQMRLRNDQMYQWKLLTPTQAENALAKPAKVPKGQPKPEPILGPRQWEALQKHVVQPEGGPAVALESDPRPALAAAHDGFTDVSQPAAADPVDFFN